MSGLIVEFKNEITEEVPLSPAVFKLPNSAYREGCVKEGKVVAVNHVANTLTVDVGGYIHEDVPFLFHTDIGYGSYVKAKAALEEENWPTFPTAPTTLYDSSTRCFVVPEGKEIKKWDSGAEDYTIPLSGTPTVLVLLYQYAENPEDSPETVVIAFDIVSDFNASRIDSTTKVDDKNRPTYWPHLFFKQVRTLADDSTVTRYFVYSLEDGADPSVVNEAGDARVSLYNLSIEDIGYWLDKTMAVPYEALIERDPTSLGRIFQPFAGRNLPPGVGGDCLDQDPGVLMWYVDEGGRWVFPWVLHTQCDIDAPTATASVIGYPYRHAPPFDVNDGWRVEVDIPEAFWDPIADLGGSTYFMGSPGKHSVNVILDPSVTKHVTCSFVHVYDDMPDHEFEMYQTLTLNDSDGGIYLDSRDMPGVSYCEFIGYPGWGLGGVGQDTGTNAFEIFRVYDARWIIERHYDFETYDVTSKGTVYFDTPDTQSYENTFTVDESLTAFINDFEDLAVEEGSVNSVLTTEIIYSPYDIRERTVPIT